jgi:RecA-family ATPase
VNARPESLGNQIASYLEGEQEHDTERAAIQGIEQEQEVPSRFDPRLARTRINLLDNPPDTVERIAGDLLRRTAGVRASAGGAGKSTLTLYEFTQIILGGDLFGHQVMRPGPCVLLTAEDERSIVEYRLCRIMEDMKLSRPHREQILENLYIEDMTTCPCRFVDVGENGSLVQTAAVPEFIDRYRNIAPSLISVDPMMFFGPGERFVNDGEGELMRAGRRISAGLKAAVRFEHHTGKSQARDRGVDQYSGRGGSAGADNARFVHVLQVHEADDKLTAPTRCTPEDVAKGNVLRLHVAKDSYGIKPSAPIWILRTGFKFAHIVPDPTLDVDPMDAQLTRLYEFLEAEETAGIQHTPNTLDNRLADLKLTRHNMRATLHVALQRKHLVEQPLPKEQQQGRRKTYLARGLRP